MKTCVVDVNHHLNKKLFVKNSTDIYKCPECGTLMADIDFVHEQYEDENYYTMIHKSETEIDLEWGFRWRYILNKIKHSSNPHTLLDVGAGNGYFVNLALNEFSIAAKGIEISDTEIKYAKEVIGIDLIKEDVAQHSLTYDVVTVFNVLEHVANPGKFLENVIERINSGGMLVVTTPNPSCYHAKIKGLKSWNMIAPPHHINLFTRKSLKILLDRYNLNEISYDTISTYINFVRKIDTNNLLLRKVFFQTLRLLNLGADHCIVAQKQK